jgi:hypothetical protein
MLAAIPERWRNRQYWLRLLRFFLVTMVMALLGLPLLQGVLFTQLLLYVPCGKVSNTPADFDLVVESITVPASAGGSFQAYYIPSENGAVVIMPPAYNGDRNGRLFQAAMLSRRGYGVFLFDSRRCSGMGPHSLGYQEVSEVVDALTYVGRRPDVDPKPYRYSWLLLSRSYRNYGGG